MSDSPLPAAAADQPADASAKRVPPHPKLIWFLVVPIVGFIIASNVGDALAPAWVEDHPLALIALNSRNRNLILATNNLDALSYYSVATIRLLASDPLFYLIGFFYGDRAIGWVEKKSKTYGPMLRGGERFFAKAAYPMVVIAPNNPICLLAGSAGMRPSIFLGLNLFGTLGRLYLIRLFGEQFDAPIQSVLDFIAEYRLPLLALSFGSVGWVVYRDMRGAKDSELGTLIQGAKEISHEELGEEEG